MFEPSGNFNVKISCKHCYMNHCKYLVLFIVFLPLLSNAQKRIPDGQNFYDDDRKGIIYNREFTVDFKMHTNGFSFGVNVAQLKSFYLTRFFNIEIGEIRHPKEFRQSFDFQAPTTNSISRSFIFGKQNNFWVLRGGIGEKRYFSEKAKRKGLAIGLSYEAGASLGLLKPYYLELIRFSEPGSNDFVIKSERFSEDNIDKFLDINSIYGSSGFSKGLGELSIRPGLHAKAAVHFDWGAFDEFVKAVEAGVMIDVFFRKVPIMVESPLVENTENQPLFINLFVNLQLGKRW